MAPIRRLYGRSLRPRTHRLLTPGAPRRGGEHLQQPQAHLQGRYRGTERAVRRRLPP